MDLKAYYQKIRDMEGRLVDQFPVLVSCGTEDGGRAGVCTEVSRSIAAKMVVEGTAREATSEEVTKFRKAQAEAKRMADDAQVAKTVQVKLVSLDEVKKLTGSTKSQDRS